MISSLEVINNKNRLFVEIVIPVNFGINLIVYPIVLEKTCHYKDQYYIYAQTCVEARPNNGMRYTIMQYIESYIWKD